MIMYTEIDAKIAETLGWNIGAFSNDGKTFLAADETGTVLDAIDSFTKTGNGMLWLIQKARKMDVDLWFSHTENGGFIGHVGIVSEGRGYDETYRSPEVSEPQVAIALAFLIAKEVDIKPFIISTKGV